MFLKRKLEGSSQYPLRSYSWWCEVFETENPLGWLLLQFILILFNIIFLSAFEPQRTLSLQLSPPNLNSAGDKEAHISSSEWRKKNKLHQMKLGYMLNPLKRKVFKK